MKNMDKRSSTLAIIGNPDSMGMPTKMHTNETHNERNMKIVAWVIGN